LNEKYQYVLERGKKKRLGKGAFGEVYLMHDITTQQLFAVKFISFGNFQDANRVLKEGLLGLKLKHENILPYVDIFLHESEDVAGEFFVCFVTEYCQKGDLRHAVDFNTVSNQVKICFSSLILLMLLCLWFWFLTKRFCLDYFLIFIRRYSSCFEAFVKDSLIFTKKKLYIATSNLIISLSLPKVSPKLQIWVLVKL
jgi:hypothetical protein